VGRTGRGGLSGLALTLLTPADEAFRASLTAALAGQQQGPEAAAAAAAAAGGGGGVGGSGSDSESDSDSDDDAEGVRGSSKKQRTAQQVGVEALTGRKFGGWGVGGRKEWEWISTRRQEDFDDLCSTAGSLSLVQPAHLV